VIYRGEHVLALVPCLRAISLRGVGGAHAARAVAGRAHAAERQDFARALKTVILKYDGLWQRPFPYIMAFHQAPTDGDPIRKRTCTWSSTRRTGCPTG
jgi:UDPglucose--hexose-1-phosphate uridylyltransferase